MEGLIAWAIILFVCLISFAPWAVLAGIVLRFFFGRK